MKLPPEIEMESELEQSTRVRIIDLNVDICDHASVIRRIAELVRRGTGGYACFSTVHMVMESHDNPEYGAKVNAADIVIPDGMPLVWMQKMLGQKDAARVRANDLMIMLCRYASENGLNVGFYGGKQEVINAIIVRAKIELPDLYIAYAYSPPFRPLTDEEDAKITSDIRESGAQILFMGLGCPKQENWMAAHKDKLNSVMLGVGASFDFYGGNVKESPEWLGVLGLEWLFRLTQEPKRLWRRYLILNPRFMWLAMLQLSGIKKFKR